MKIKYKLETTFTKENCATLCPNGYIHEEEAVYVYSKTCSECKFYKGSTLFGQKVICAYDKKAGIR